MNRKQIERAVLHGVGELKTSRAVFVRGESFHRLGFSLLDRVELVSALEDRFNLELGDNEFEYVRNSKDVDVMASRFHEVAKGERNGN